MLRNKIPKVWSTFFFFGFGLLSIHMIRYLNVFVFHLVPWNDTLIDYSWYSIESLYLRLISLLISLITLINRKRFPVLANSIIWLILWILLSHEIEKYIFVSIPIIIIFSLLSSFYYFKKGFTR